jgi:hypothetical protein
VARSIKKNAYRVKLLSAAVVQGVQEAEEEAEEEEEVVVGRDKRLPAFVIFHGSVLKLINKVIYRLGGAGQD